MKYREYDESDDLSPQRKLLYYGGMVLSGIGLFLILSIFVSAALSLRASEKPSFAMFMLRGVGGMMLMIAGGIVRGIGERGLDVSSAARNRQMTREDLEPFTNAINGRTRDTADRSGFLPLPLKTWEETEPLNSEIGYTPRDGVEEFKAESREYREAAKIQVRVRCRYCRSLSPEDANYCDQCGAKL